ncbi:carboxymuconolactone decarboxylase family protein [Paenibacillus xerothermodurans]|nr:carboxymuconolactone decarboxylase family protein [Paenibacillus xerothermodurans]
MNDNMPKMVDAYHHFTAACFEGGALSEKQKHLIALGISLFANNEVCTYYHVQEAVAKGASEAEIMEAVAVAAAVGSGHSMAQGVTRVQTALDSLGVAAPQ